MTASLPVQMQASSRVPTDGTPLVSWCFPHETALETASSLITGKLKNGSCASFPYQTTQGLNIPLEPTKIQIWANNSPSLNKWLTLFSSISHYSSPSLISCSSRTHKSFLHASTPERRTRALAHLFKQREHGQ